MALASDFQLLSSTRYDKSLLDVEWNTLANGGVQSPYLLLTYHYDRLCDAARQHGWTAQNFTIDDLRRVCDEAVRDTLHDHSSPDGPLKVRIILANTGTLIASASPVHPLPSADPILASLFAPSGISSDIDLSPFGPLLTIHPDIRPTTSTLFTRTKTTYRPHYTAARTRLNIPPLPTPSNADVLLYTPSGELTETSTRNIAFFRGSPPHWVTPRTETGCLPGIMRRWLLGKGRVTEAVQRELTRDDLVEGEYVLTFNGVEGCRLGRIMFVSRDISRTL
ncbi:hypothetical protein AcW1_001117 [Taiwanofungus camphoratus]|nr:hypothetical protein AcW2_000371 [Antrodia cinnamomea]KAI0937037.1 hypothetical protein AcV5_005032 [Antrodia cinnamomea]KAI0964255.1 hypothetical protein AcW1_001117 [Antrodia cinnamomea]